MCPTSALSKLRRKRALFLTFLVLVLLIILCCVIYHCWRLNRDTKHLIEATEQVLAEERRKDKWEEYKIHIELYKYYLDIFLKASLALLGITGGILTFYFNDKTGSDGLLKKALYLPLTFSLAYAGVYLYGAWLWCKVSVTVELLRKQLGLERVPDIQILTVLLVVFGAVFYIMGVALLWFIWRDVLPRSSTREGTPDNPSGSTT